MKRKRTKVQLPPPPPLPPLQSMAYLHPPRHRSRPRPPATVAMARLPFSFFPRFPTGQRGRTSSPTAAACMHTHNAAMRLRYVDQASRCGRTQVQFRCYGFLPLSLFLLRSTRARTTGPAAIHRALDLPFFLPAPRCRSSERWTRRRRRRREEKPARARPRLDLWRSNLLLGFQGSHHQQHRLLALEAAGGKRTYLRT